MHWRPSFFISWRSLFLAIPVCPKSCKSLTVGGASFFFVYVFSRCWFHTLKWRQSFVVGRINTQQFFEWINNRSVELFEFPITYAYKFAIMWRSASRRKHGRCLLRRCTFSMRKRRERARSIVAIRWLRVSIIKSKQLIKRRIWSSDRLCEPILVYAASCPGRWASATLSVNKYTVRWRKAIIAKGVVRWKIFENICVSVGRLWKFECSSKINFSLISATLRIDASLQTTNYRIDYPQYF